jgi:hypothetical protein
LLESLKKDAQKTFDEIFPKTEVKNLELIFEMKESVNKWKPDRMLVLNDFIYLSSQNSNLVWRLNQKTKEGIFIPLEIDKVKFSLPFGKNPIFLSSNGQIEGLETKVSLIFPKDYFWMAIDGKIYLLSSKKILKLGQGKIETEFDLTKIYPKIQSPNKISTQKENPFIYIRDKNEILILNKGGNFIKLLSFPQIKNLVDFFVEADGKVIYLLDGMKIWKAKI